MLEEREIRTAASQDLSWALELKEKGLLHYGVLCVVEKDLGLTQCGGLYMAFALVVDVCDRYFIDETGRRWEAADPIKSTKEIKKFLLKNLRKKLKD